MKATATRTAQNPYIYIRKTTTLHVHHAFCLLLHDCDMKRPNFTHPLHGVGEHNTDIFDFFSKLRYGPFGFNPENFASIGQIK